MKSRHNPIIVLIFLFCLYPLTLQAADPPAPQNLQASDGTYATKVLITWQESTGAVSYRVWVADNSEFIAAGLLGETSDTWMEHSFGTPGETYWYRSKARNSEYEWSGFSDPDSGWRETPATAPENVTASDGTYSDKVVVEWDAAESGNEYMVYRAVGDSPNKSQVTGWQNETSYEDTDVTPDTFYHYWVRTRHLDSVSQYSEEDSGYAHTPVTLLVPGPHGTTIQEVLDVALNGDTVEVVDGTYTGPGNYNLDFNGKAVTLTSQNGPSSCIIDCSGNGCGFYFSDDEGNDSKVSGFTIINGGNHPPGFGMAINCLSSSPTIENCVIKESQSGIIINLLSSDAIIKECIITENSAGNTAVDINAGAPDFINCIIAGNPNACGIRLSGAASPRIVNCTIADNTHDTYGGIDCSNYSTPGITNCIIWDNTPAQIQSDTYSTPTVSYSNVEGGYAGVSNINMNPEFMNPGNNDYHLRPISPCIDSGILAKKVYAGGMWFVYYDFVPDEDFEGDSRSDDWIEVTPNHFYKYCDIGADEFTPKAMPWLMLLLVE